MPDDKILGFDPNSVITHAGFIGAFHHYCIPGPGGHPLVLRGGVDSAGNPIAVPKQYQAPGYQAPAAFTWTDPKASFGPDGVCKTAGFDPGGVWYSAGDKTGHPSGASPRLATGVALIAQGLAMVKAG